MGRIEFRHRRWMSRHACIGLCALSFLAVACGGGTEAGDRDAGGADAGDGTDADVAPGDATLVDPTDALFDPNRVIEVSISLAPADWAVLREQPDVIGMPKITCGNQPTARPYDYFPGDITIDGVTVANVGVRKKGGFGSISSTRPGLKIKPAEYVPGRRIAGLKRLTLNNNHQDDTLISQCLGYGLFRDAGLAASRCNFAHVTVNGEDLGIYSNVESIKEDFLARHFEDGTGRLYESGGEFAPGATGGFQPKVNKTNPDCSDLPPVVAALQAPDSQLLASLDAVVDVDAFMTYWAMEVITDHWDGYANNQNNFFFYHDPTSNKLHFIPWGIDALFTGRERTTRPDSVFACGSMPWRLYDVPETRALYLAKLRELLGSVWDETAILAEINRMEALLEPIADPGNTGDFADQIQLVRDFVSSQRGVLTAELDAGDPVWPYAAGTESCRISLGTLAGTFDTTWDSLDNFSAGTATMTGTISGVAIDSTTGFSNSGLTGEGTAAIQMFAELPDGRLAVIFVIVQDPLSMVPGTRPIDLVNVAAFMTFYDPVLDETSGGGLILGGNLTLTSANTTTGAPVVGSMTGEVFEL